MKGIPELRAERRREMMDTKERMDRAARSRQRLVAILAGLTGVFFAGASVSLHTFAFVIPAVMAFVVGVFVWRDQV